MLDSRTGRTFNGRQYSRYSTHDTKKEATEAKGRAKRKGLLVRIVKGHSWDNSIVYRVYARIPEKCLSRR